MRQDTGKINKCLEEAKKAPEHHFNARGFLWYRVKNSTMQIPA